MRNEKAIIGGLVWTFAERILAQMVTTIVSIILARLLTPEHYGIISVVMVFMAICNVLVTSGFGSSVIQAKKADDKDFDTAFWMSFGLAIALEIIVYVSAPMIAAFYQIDALTPVLRIMGIRIPLAALNAIQQAYIRRQMEFKRFFVATLAGTVLSGIAGVLMAYGGFGVWALVTQYLTNTVVNTIILWFICGWTPRFRFSANKAKGIFSFGWKILAADMIATLESDIRSLVIGKVFSTADLAYFDQGKKYPALLVTNINSSVNKVMLPAYSAQQGDLVQLKRMLRSSVQMGIFMLAPILMGFAAVSESFVRVVLTPKWLDCVPYMQIFCMVYLTRPLETMCHQSLLAIGKSSLVLRIMACINAAALIAQVGAALVFEDAIFVAWGSVAATATSLVCFMTGVRRHIGYRYREQIADLLPSLVCGGIMAAVVILLGRIKLQPIALMLLQIVCGAIVYILAAICLRVDGLNLVIRKVFHRHGKDA